MSIDGVEMLIGNDLAGKRVIPKLQMVEDPVKELWENTLEQLSQTPQVKRNWCLKCFQSAR